MNQVRQKLFSTKVTLWKAWWSPAHDRWHFSIDLRSTDSYYYTRTVSCVLAPMQSFVFNEPLCRRAMMRQLIASLHRPTQLIPRRSCVASRRAVWTGYKPTTELILENCVRWWIELGPTCDPDFSSLTLISDLDLRSQESYGHVPYTCKTSRSEVARFNS